MSAKKLAPRIVVESNGNALLDTEGEVLFGARTGCDVVLDDPVVAARHCRIAFEDGFRVRDLDSVTGTWVDGKAARPSAAIADGSEIVIGISKLVAKVEPRDGVATLVLDLQRNVFWWKRSGKGVFDNDPDAMVRAEVSFGRFRALELGNRIALVAALVLLFAGTFVAAVMGPLADPGPLLPSHALVAEVAAGAKAPHAAFEEAGRRVQEQGCNVCHTTGAGTPANKCLKCHGDLAAPATWRHPYLLDGTLKALPGLDPDTLCTVCHRDHQGREFLKPASDLLVGHCEICHGDGKVLDDAAKERKQKELVDSVPATAPPQGKHEFATYRFPHDVHLGKKIACTICHAPSRAAQERFAAGASNADQDDFDETPFEVCASCHVPGALAKNMTAAEQAQWSSKEHQWPVTWHGTDEDGKHCKRCHTASQRNDHTVFGPELATVDRPLFTPQQYADERGKYVAGRRLHEAEFLIHSKGKACTQCHLSGALAKVDPPPARTFWHALHVADGNLRPPAGKRAEISSSRTEGCLACHGDLQQAVALRTADQGGYRWPAEAEAQAACKACHRQGKDEQIVLQPTTAVIGPERRGPAVVFPHDVHVNSVEFGKPGKLAFGCFTCHEFESTGADFAMVPRTKSEAACSQCHAGHERIGGNHCQECHPTEAGRSNSFLLSAMVPPDSTVFGRVVPPPPQRNWPKSPFSHLSRGHVGPDIQCATCHGATGIEGNKSLEDVPIPDDRTPVCRACHVKKQFHWR